MKIVDFEFFDAIRGRKIPVAVHLPVESINNLPVVIFSPGFQGQESLEKEDVKYAHKKQIYLAEYFVNLGYAFITIQHDILGDKDGLDTIDPKAIQHDARKHLYIRGVDNILYVLKELEQQPLNLKLDRFIIGGHSNGGDIAKYFTNMYPDLVTHIIAFDARRARLEPKGPVKLLMFEANDTSTDLSVLPDPDNKDNIMRSHLEWIVIKPKDAVHASYMDDYMTDNIKHTIFKALNWFLDSPITIDK